jgi:hypothetical protein
MTAHPQWPHTLNDAIAAEIGSQRQSDPKIVLIKVEGTQAFTKLNEIHKGTARRGDPPNYGDLCPFPADGLFVPRASAVPVSELQRRAFPDLPVPLPRMRLRRVALPRPTTTEVQREPEAQKELSGRRQPSPGEACRRLCRSFR